MQAGRGRSGARVRGWGPRRVPASSAHGRSVDARRATVFNRLRTVAGLLREIIARLDQALIEQRNERNVRNAIESCDRKGK
jgi:hypothetical protein